mmetsp:Transcript_2822/g.6675  ORF Transcript_2822/g.6675 Transcript_2822/m.6675 type:complete len:283 (-) Transcript_2822:1043-1891(-)
MIRSSPAFLFYTRVSNRFVVLLVGRKPSLSSLFQDPLGQIPRQEGRKVWNLLVRGKVVDVHHITFPIVASHQNVKAKELQPKGSFESLHNRLDLFPRYQDIDGNLSIITAALFKAKILEFWIGPLRVKLDQIDSGFGNILGQVGQGVSSVNIDKIPQYVNLVQSCIVVDEFLDNRLWWEFCQCRFLERNEHVVRLFRSGRNQGLDNERSRKRCSVSSVSECACQIFCILVIGFVILSLGNNHKPRRLYRDPRGRLHALQTLLKDICNFRSTHQGLNVFGIVH